MVYRIACDSDGTLVDIMQLHRRRLEFLLKKRGEDGLSGAEMRELEANHYAKMIRNGHQEALYGKMMLEQTLKNNPKD